MRRLAGRDGGVAPAPDAVSQCTGANPASACRQAGLCIPSGCECTQQGWSCSPDCTGGRDCGDDGSTVPTRAELLSNEEEATDERLAREDEVALLREAILGLNDQERTVLSLYYFEELKSADIADVLGISESRVSQIRSKALARLRTELAPMRASA